MKDRAIVLMYHNIGIPPEGAGLRGLYVTPRMFGFQMWYLRAAGFRVVPLREIIELINGGITGKRLVAITFDDGYMDFYVHAYPVLRKYGFPATVFAVAGHVGGENEWDAAELNVRKRLMGWAEIMEVSCHGIEIGAHSMTHPFLSRLDMDRIREEVQGPKAALGERLGRPVEFFCYPYGDYDDRVAEAAKEAGYLGAVTTRRGLVRAGDDPFCLRRSLVRLTTNPFLFLHRLHTGYEDRKGMRG